MTSDWTSRKNGSSNRKKLMSRPKIGSVTVCVGENGTRLTHSIRVSQAPETAPATPSARSTAMPPITQRPDRDEVGDLLAVPGERQLARAGPPAETR